MRRMRLIGSGDPFLEFCGLGWLSPSNLVCICRGGIRTEDMLLVTERGYDVLPNAK